MKENRGTKRRREAIPERRTNRCKGGLGHFPPDFSPGENANNFVEIEAGMMKQHFSSRSWIDKTIRCELEAGLMKEILTV